MLILLSPSKTQDFVHAHSYQETSLPRQLDESEILINQLRKFSPAEIANIMNISDKLSNLNHDRFKNWSRPFTVNNSKPALFAFKGDVYDGLNAEHLDPSEIQFAQIHLRILSGLYGVLRPLDLIQPYRLEMGIKLPNPQGKDLYAYWKKTISKIVQQDLAHQGDDILINLASQEYYVSIDVSKINARVVTPKFLDGKDGRYRMISFYAKYARGLMARWILQNKPTGIEDLAAFSAEGYHLDSHTSNTSNPVYVRP
ncbi:MAG TPA: peroxide stress protein YaaA [Burkholderiales bacterium]|nr:peroxide stress protein YaaA [Burkholderiales bacterium]